MVTLQNQPIIKTPSLGGILQKETKAVVVQKGWRKAFLSYLRRSMIVVLNILLNHHIIFRIVGFANKHLKIIESVFLAYPANDNYALAYVYPSRLSKVQWNPWPVGLLWQNGKLAIMFVISASNNDFRKEENIGNLRHVAGRMEWYRQTLHVKRKTFAGILPGVLFGRRIIRDTHEADTTVKAIELAIRRVRVEEKLSVDAPIIVLGGRGFIGRKVFANLPAENLYCVDTANGCEWPAHLHGHKTLLVNITDNGALDEYVPKLWSGIVVLNEVYPEPKSATIQRLKQLGCVCYHIQGVEGRAFPSFPHAYHGAIPCCSARSCGGMKVSLQELV